MSNGISIGNSFAGCKILAMCGKGAYGEVYLAENALGRKIVIKVVQNTPNAQRELCGLRHYVPISNSHPALLKIFHVGEWENGFYYTMEAADNLNDDGTYQPATLGNMFRSGKKFSPDESLTVIRQLLYGIRALHAANLVHRDIKPDNIIFVDGEPKLSDPGLITEDGQQVTLAGTPGFIPPETLTQDLPVTHQTDLYALGKVLYCMITGNPPGKYPLLPREMRIEVARQMAPVLMRGCNNNPTKRFKSIEEFLDHLPEVIKKPNWLERKRIDFRDWKALNREKYRWLVALFAGILLLLAAGGVFAIYAYVRLQNQIAACQEETLAFLELNKDRKELLSRQFEAYLPEELPQYQKQEQALAQLVKKQQWRAAAAKSRDLNIFLQKSAKKLQPAISGENQSRQQKFSVSGAAHGFLSTPLAAYLSPTEQTGYKQKLKEFDEELFRDWMGPKCGEMWDSFDNADYPAAFIPPGAVKVLNHDKLIKIPYHFWIGKKEVDHAQFNHFMGGFSPQKSPHQGTPVERVLWNDALEYCLVMTDVLRRNNKLPPGYIVRLPKEEEWEIAAQNAWLGADTTPLLDRAIFQENANGRTQPPGSKLPNKIGIFDIYGNVAELVHPVVPNAMKHSATMRGASYASPAIWHLRKIPTLKYQNIPNDIGFRFVIAPGTMDYFDQHFFNGGSNQLRTHGKVFELIGENFGCFDWERANEFCQLLGGKLAELETEDLWKTVCEKMPLAAGVWGCPLGAQKINGKWQWISSGKEVNFGQWKKANADSANYLSMQNHQWLPVRAKNTAAIFICQWNEKEYPTRNKQLENGKKLPRELLRFTVGDRKFMLINSSMAWYTARRFCELLGGRLACLDTPEIHKEVIEKLKSYSDSEILLGGYVKYGQWQWLSGIPITTKLPPGKSQAIPTRNKNFVVLKDGKLFNANYSRYFLCEWVSNISPSN